MLFHLWRTGQKSHPARQRRRVSSPAPRKRPWACAPGIERLENRTLLSAGALDPGFGSGGRLITDIPGSTDDYSGSVVVAQPDHKIVVLGFAENYHQSEDVIARYNPDGSLDPMFGSGGLISLDMATAGRLNDVTVDGAGRIVAAGYSPTYDFTAFRFNPDGTADTTFGPNRDGNVVTDLGGFDLGSSVTTDSAGRILVTGNTDGRVGLVRYTSDGSLDAGFAGGIVLTDLRSPSFLAGGVAVGSDGRIFVAGTATRSGTGSDLGVAAYNPDGSLDTTFGPDGDGIAAADFGSLAEDAYRLALDSDGHIVVAGTTQRYDPANVSSTYYYDFAVARFNPDGSVDTTFGPNQDGKVVSDVTRNSNVPSSLAIDSADRVVLTADDYRGPATYYDIVTLRYTADGTPDTTFGEGGTVFSDFGTADFAGGVATDGSRIVLGASIQGKTTGEDFALVGLSDDGSPDTTFGRGGLVTTDIPGPSDNYAQAVVVTQPDGKILVAGTSADVTARVTLARYNPDGSADTTFGSGGVVNVGFGDFGGALAGLAVNSSGQILVAGRGFRAGTGGDFAVGRLNADGSLDTSFGQSGVAFADFGGEESVGGVALDGSGRIVVAGQSDRAVGRDVTTHIAVARFNPDGSLDTTFGTGGKVIGDLDTALDAAVGVAIDASGRVVVAGNSFDPYEGDGQVVLCYNPDGTPDTTFGSDHSGVARADFGMFSGSAASLVIDRGGRILVGGSAGYPSDFGLVAFTPDGSLDTSFGQDLNGDGTPDGNVLTDFGGSDDWITSLAIDAQGRITAAGGSDQGTATGYDFAVARYNADGSLDTTFGAGGMVTTDFGSGDDGANGVTTDALNRIIAVGYTNQSASGTGYDFAVARYDGYTATSTVLVTTPTPTRLGPVFGQPVTFTATVTPESGSETPTGSVDFCDETAGRDLGTFSLSGGSASLTTSSLTVGDHTIEALYSGDARFAPSSGSATETVTPASTSVVVTASANPISVDQDFVTLTATVQPDSSNGTPATGTLTFKDGGTPLETVTVGPALRGSVFVVLPGAGSHNITVDYSGDGSYLPSSGQLTEVVARAATLTTLTPANPVTPLFSSATFTATVTPTNANYHPQPSGTVQFFDGGALLGSSPVDTSGHTSFTTSSLTLGSHTITAVYSGNDALTGSAGSASVQVSKAFANLVVTSSENPASPGDVITLTVSGTPATGTVTVVDLSAGVALGTATLTAGRASLTATLLTPGLHLIGGVYSGDANYTSSALFNLEEFVLGYATTTTVTPSLNPVVHGQAVTFTATVANAGGTTDVPTGSVQFSVDGSPVGGPTALTNGIATCPGILLAAGSHTVTAAYLNTDGTFRPSAGTLAGGEQVNPMTSANLQQALATQGQITITTATAADAQAFFSAANGLDPAMTPAGTVTLDLQGLSVMDTVVNVPSQLTLIITNGNLNGGSPALIVQSGRVIVHDATFTNATDAPTILVTGGSLSLRNDVIQESAGFNNAAVSVLGGVVDLGIPADPGGNTLNVNDAGTFFRNTTGSPISAVGDIFERNGQTTAWPTPLTVTVSNSLMLVGNSSPPLSGSVNGTRFTGSIQYPTVYGDEVTFTLGTLATSDSSVGRYAISATLSGASADNYVIDLAALRFGTMYVVSLGGDPTSTAGAQAVAFWDNKGNAKLITAADLSSLDALNLVNQGGAAFDPTSAQQVQAWLSTPTKATAAYRLSVQLAALDLNVRTGFVKASDLVFAGQLLPYETADGITGLTGGGFLDVQDLMSAANAVLSQAKPGAPAADPNQTYETALAQVLQAVNGNTDFVSQELLWSLVSLYPSL
jgi:uncharacterized delta-60 repeat protein